ncbi:MAG: hypothetical protein JW751_02320 [Polyangiaceae bacterium]|nr:hypothetical protein [Polyangiaceae bacterium]
MSGRSRSDIPRDQALTAFGVTLRRFCDASGAFGAALVDAQGESVDYAGRVDPYDIRVSAAEWRLVLDLALACRSLNWSETTELIVRGPVASYAAIPLTEGYALVAVLPPRSFHVSPRAVAEAVREISVEAGLAIPRAWSDARWTRVEVDAGPLPGHRPKAIWREGRWHPFEILGRYAPEALGHRESGFRGRLDCGTDLTLVREPGGTWYADGLPDV